MLEPLPPEYSAPRVVCAALREQGGEIILGPRHFDTTMRNQIAHSHIPDIRYWGSADSGFIDQFGRFLNREEAWEIAVAAGQIFRECGPGGGGSLYSEHLY